MFPTAAPPTENHESKATELSLIKATPIEPVFFPLSSLLKNGVVEFIFSVCPETPYNA